jgi:hypothetical protein
LVEPFCWSFPSSAARSKSDVDISSISFARWLNQLSQSDKPKTLWIGSVAQFRFTDAIVVLLAHKLLNAFSKKLENHKAAMALHFANYNLCRIHRTLRVTPAMAAGVTDHVWTIAELIDAVQP